MNQTIDYRTAAYMNDISPVKLLEKLRDAGVIYDRGPQRNQPKPGFTHLFDTEHHSYQVGKVARLHTMLTVRPAGITYLRALYSGDTKTTERLSVAAITPAEIAHQRIEEMKAQLQ